MSVSGVEGQDYLAASTHLLSCSRAWLRCILTEILRGLNAAVATASGGRLSSVTDDPGFRVMIFFTRSRCSTCRCSSTFPVLTAVTCIVR